MALVGKKVNFDKVLKMIDELVAALGTEQQDDDHKKEYCEGQIDMLEDKKKGLMEETKEKIATTADEIEALEDGIKQLDKDVAEATDTRKEEHEDYKTLMTSDT